VTVVLDCKIPTLPELSRIEHALAKQAAQLGGSHYMTDVSGDRLLLCYEFDPLCDIGQFQAQAEARLQNLQISTLED
jgi:hypothetical protein